MEIHSAYVQLFSVLNGRLSFWKDSSCPPVFSSNVSFWDYPGLNVRSLWIFQVDDSFYKLDIKIQDLAACGALGKDLIMSSRSV